MSAPLTFRHRLALAGFRFAARRWPDIAARALDAVAAEQLARGASPRVLAALAEIRARVLRGNADTATALLEHGPRRTA